MRYIITFIVCLVVPIPAFSSTIVVPDDYATIQAAIDQSANGDTIIVKPGVYVENIDFIGKAITLESEMGAVVTKIDGNQTGSVVVFQKGENVDSILDGFTLTNGNGTLIPPSLSEYGGGICCYNSSSPMILNNIITGNNADFGGGIYAEFSSPSISGNRITQNTTTGEGAAILCYYSDDIVIDDNVINRNSTSEWGAGVELIHSTSITIVGNIITENVAVNNGSGGILFARDCTGDITNNIIQGNTVASFGSGIDIFFNSHATLTNNTVCGNSANKGGGLSCRENSSVAINNTIFWGNTANVGPQMFLNTSFAPSSATIDYSDVQGGQASVHLASGCSLSWGSSMIDSDPLFVDSVYEDFHLTYDSPCRDSGDNSAIFETVDFEGDPRIVLGTVDMGADELYYHLYHTGIVIPGGNIDLKVVGYPSAPVQLAWGRTVLDPPLATQHGELHIWPIVWFGYAGKIPSEGVLVKPVTIPSSWSTGDIAPMQALIGPWGGAHSQLTNLNIVTVE